jgi:lantibiotic modifying enzyme
VPRKAVDARPPDLVSRFDPNGQLPFARSSLPLNGACGPRQTGDTASQNGQRKKQLARSETQDPEAGTIRRIRRGFRPLLDGSLRKRALAAVQEIIAALPDPSSTELNDASLSGGTAGLAIFCAYLSRVGLDTDENAVQFLEQALRSISTTPMDPSFYGGFTGIAWAAAQLEEQLLDSDEDPTEAIDEALIDYLSRSPWMDDYDLIGGLIGIGVYALERLPRASAVTCLEQIVGRLNETAEHNKDGVTWLTRAHLLPEHQREKCPNGYYNLGLAHGVPGVIALLGQTCAAGVALEKSRPLLDGAVAWLLRQRLDNAAASCFTAWVAPDVERDDCRLAWCYGDAGVAAALFVAARCVNEADWEREAIEIARRAAKRKPESAGVNDAGLCHGAAGLGHIFNRLFQATGESVFREAARYWFERTLAMRRAGQGIAGFSSYRPGIDGQKEHWEDEIGILEGAAGIGLALLAAATDVEPAWDRMLLVSIPAALSKKPF